MGATPTHDVGTMRKDVYGLAGTFASEAGYDFSYFDLTVPSRSFETGLGLLAEGITQPRLDGPVVDEALARAKALSRTTLGGADRASVNAVRARLHAGSPLVSPLAVTEAEFSVLTPTLVQRFYREHYVAENLTVVVTGDVDAEDAAARVQKAFDAMPHGKAASRSRINEKAFQGPQIAIERNASGTRGAAIAVGFPAPVWGSA